MPIAPRPNSIGLPSSSNITSYWSNRRGCDAPSFSRGLSADPDTELDSLVALDSAPKALFRIQTGQNSLSAVVTKFVPQTGHVRGSRCTDPSDSAFTASAVLERRLAHGSRPEPWQPGPRYLPLSCRSPSSRTHFELDSNGTAEILHSFRHAYAFPQIDW